jgi:hypothetical protein
VPHRPLALVSALGVGDYLLWNWSLSHSHDVLALISGLTLPPLVIAALWLLALSVARLLARSTRRTPGSSQADARTREAERSSAPSGSFEQSPAPSSQTAASSRKIAA